MNPLNYYSSFITGLSPENRVRFWVESRTRIIDEQAGVTEDYYQCGSCKAEDTFAGNDLFLPDNYDFLPVYGPEYGLIFRRRAYLHDGYRETKLVRNMWDGQRYRLHEHDQAERLDTDDAICKATHEGALLIGQTELAGSGMRAIIEYPVKTMNIRDATTTYQVDTGPVLLPDLSRRHSRLVDSLRLAYVAFNTAEFADFVIEVPTVLRAENGAAAATTCHYSERVSLQSSNRLFSVPC